MDSRQGGIGVFGALSIGVGGIVGGGFFATFGITAAGAAGGTPIAFLIGGAIALLTAYSYIGLTLTYPGPGGTVSFITRAFGDGLFSATVNVLLTANATGGVAAVATEYLNGFPTWYQDERGVRVGQCADPANALCIAAPIARMPEPQP